MRRLLTKIALLGMAFFGSLPLRAGQDGVALKAPRVALPGAFQAGLGVFYSVQQSWALGQRFAYLREANGVYVIQRQVDLRLDLAWQLNRDWGLKLGLPYNLSEASPFPPAGFIPSYRLDDPFLRRNESLGDINLELRRAWGPESGLPGASAGFSLDLMAPTGIGPFEAPSTLAATGEGRWQILPTLLAQYQWGALRGSLQAGGTLQLGRESTLSSEAALGFGADGPQLPKGGNLWLGPRYGVQGVAAFAWDWYVDEDSRHSLGVELSARQRSALDQGGVLTPDTEQSSAGFIPFLQSGIGPFHALAAWSLPLLAGNNVGSSIDGGSHLRVDYEF